ncbi:MAG: methionyl-tRNA formyltransferase [Proteobacteria bacterium]|nr:methionyl-tRNA formyltransferase [Pseudomonadota bacterium]
MKIAFLGTPEISAYVLQKLHDGGIDIKWVATQPDRESGRGRKITPPSVKVKAQILNIDVLQSDKFDRSFFEKIKKYGEIDIAIVIAYGMYIPTYFLDYPKYGCLNIHFSLLPKYRGSAPVARAIMNGEKKTGVSIMKLVKEMDAGDIVAEERLNIELGDTTESLTWSLVKIGTDLLIKTIPLYVDGKIKPISQDSLNIKPNYADKIRSDEKSIDWNKRALEIHDKIRALYPWPIAESRINGSILKLIKTWPEGLVSTEDEKLPVGTVISVDKKDGIFAVKTANGALLVEKVQPSGKREMLVSEFLNGYEIKKGMRFE